VWLAGWHWRSAGWWGGACCAPVHLGLRRHGAKGHGWSVEISLDPLDSDDIGIFFDDSTERAQRTIRRPADQPIRLPPCPDLCVPVHPPTHLGYSCVTLAAS
jgi:hypothetical protein